MRPWCGELASGIAIGRLLPVWRERDGPIRVLRSCPHHDGSGVARFRLTRDASCFRRSHEGPPLHVVKDGARVPAVKGLPSGAPALGVDSMIVLRAMNDAGFCGWPRTRTLPTPV